MEVKKDIFHKRVLVVRLKKKRMCLIMMTFKPERVIILK